MAELRPTEGDNTPPPLIPPPLGFAGQGDAYSQGAPSLGPVDNNPYPSAPASALRDWPILGGAVRYAQDILEVAPLGDRGAVRSMSDYQDAKSKYGMDDPRTAAARDQLDVAAFGVIAGITGGLGGKRPAPSASEVRATPGFLRTAEQKIAAPTVTSSEKYAGNINLDRLALPDDAKGIIKVVQDQQPPRVVQPHEETVALANEILLSSRLTGVDPVDLVANLAKKQLTAEQVTAIRVASAEQVSTAALATADAVKGGLTPQGVVAAERELLRYLEMSDSLSGVTTGAGRTLDAFNIIVDGAHGNYAAASEALAKLGNVELRKDYLKLLAQIDPKDQGRLGEFVRKVEGELAKPLASGAKPVDVGWWMQHIFINGIMSGLSNVRNVVGNTAKLGKTVAEVYGSTLLPTGPSLSAANAFTSTLLTRGVRRGMARGWGTFIHRSIGDFAKLDTATSDLLRYPTRENGVGKIVAGTADFIGLPGRSMVAADSFYKGMYEEAFKALHATQAADVLKLTGDKRAGFIADRIVNPSVKEVRLARDAAIEYTYNARTPLAKWAIEGRDKVPLGIGRLIVPFVNTPTNILKDAVQSTPAGFIGANKAAGAFGEAERAVRYSRAILGSTAMAVIYAEMAQGNITGYNPYRYGTTEADIWAKDNLELGVKTPWGELSLLNYPPFSTVGKFVASIQDTQRKHGADGFTPELLSRILLRMADTTLDESFFNGITSLQDAINDPDRSAKTWIRQIATAPIPYSGALRLYNQVQGVAPRDPQSFEDYMISNLPVLGETLRPKIGALGPAEPRTNTGVLAFVPSRVQQPHADEFERRLLYLKDFGLTIPEPVQSDVGRGVKLNDAELYELRKATYPKTLDALHETMGKPGFNSLPEQEQVRLLKNAFDAARNDAKVETAMTVLLPRATTPEAVASVALIGLSAYSRQADKARWIEDIQKAGKMTPAAAQAIDDARPAKAPGLKADPTVAEYIRFAPLVQKYLATKPFLIGDPTTWKKLESARRDYNAAKAVNAFAPKPSIVSLYELPSVVNPARARLVSLNKGLDRFVTDSTYLWRP